MSHHRISGRELLGWSTAVVLGMMIYHTTPALAETTIQRLLRNTPQSQLQFSPFTVGSIIAGATDRVYVLKANKGQFLRIQVYNTGARAYVAVFNAQGKELKILTDASELFEYELPQTGDYYIFCHGGPTYHFYDLSVRVD